MNNNTLLYRQINPKWKQGDGVNSQAFEPSRSHDRLLSVYDGDLISAEESWIHFTRSRCSIGVLAVTIAECHTQDLEVRPEPQEFKEHAVIDFRNITNKKRERKADRLTEYANQRGWCFHPDYMSQGV